MPTESPQQEPTDLGKDVERAIEEFWLNCQRHGPPEKLSLADCGPCQVAKGLLESAIRARIDQPRPEPSFEGTPFPTHQCWCKDTLAEHRDCKRRGFHLCGCGATTGLVSDRWIGGLAGKPVRTPQVPAQRFEFVDEATEPLPQHIFERQDRTSKHSLPRPIVKTSRQHELSVVVYDLLGFNEPSMVAQWIGEARRIAGEAALVAERAHLP